MTFCLLLSSLKHLLLCTLSASCHITKRKAKGLVECISYNVNLILFKCTCSLAFISPLQSYLILSCGIWSFTLVSPYLPGRQQQAMLTHFKFHWKTPNQLLSSIRRQYSLVNTSVYLWSPKQFHFLLYLFFYYSAILLRPLYFLFNFPLFDLDLQSQMTLSTFIFLIFIILFNFYYYHIFCFGDSFSFWSLLLHSLLWNGKSYRAFITQSLLFLYGCWLVNVAEYDYDISASQA